MKKSRFRNKKAKALLLCIIAYDFYGGKRYKKRRTKRYVVHGGPEEIRTLDLSDANRTLSQLSYRPKRLTYYIRFRFILQALFRNFFFFSKTFFKDGKQIGCFANDAAVRTTAASASFKAFLSCLRYFSRYTRVS